MGHACALAAAAIREIHRGTLEWRTGHANAITSSTAVSRAFNRRAACASGKRSMEAVVVLMTLAITVFGMVAYTRDVAQYSSYDRNRNSKAVLRGRAFA